MTQMALNILGIIAPSAMVDHRHVESLYQMVLRRPY